MDKEKDTNGFWESDETEHQATGVPFGSDDDDEPVEGAISGGADENDGDDGMKDTEEYLSALARAADGNDKPSSDASVAEREETPSDDGFEAGSSSAGDEKSEEAAESDSEKDGEKTKKNSISSDLIRGHINTIILRTLYEGDRYGYDIINEIEHKSHGQYTLKQPTLYSALKRLESQGYVKSYWGGVSNGGRRRYFSLTEAGREVAEQNQAEWEYSRTIIDSLISENDFDFSNPAPEKLDFRILRQATSRTPIVEEESVEPYPSLIMSAKDGETPSAPGTIDTVETVTAEIVSPFPTEQENKNASGEDGAPSLLEQEAAQPASAEADKPQTEQAQTTQEQTNAVGDFASVESPTTNAPAASPPQPVAETGKEEIATANAAFGAESAGAQASAANYGYAAPPTEDRQNAVSAQPQANAYGSPSGSSYAPQTENNGGYGAQPARENTAAEEKERPIPPLYITRTDEERNYKEIVSRIYRTGIKHHEPPTEEAEPETFSPAEEPILQGEEAQIYAEPPQSSAAEMPQEQSFADDGEPAVKYNEESYEKSRPLTPGRIDFQDVEEMARYDGLRVWTAGSAAQKREMPEDFFNKGLALFRASLIFFAVAIAETVLAAVFRENLQLEIWYLITMLVCAVVPPAVCMILYFAKFQPCCKRLKNNTSVYNGIVAFIATFILLVAVDLIADVNLTDAVTVVKFIVVPLVYLLNIIVFAVAYYFLSRSKI